MTALDAFVDKIDNAIEGAMPGSDDDQIFAVTTAVLKVLQAAGLREEVFIFGTRCVTRWERK